nr:MAG: SLOG family protein [Candidatus Methanoperedens sp.]
MNNTKTKIAFTGHRHLSFAQVAQYLEKLLKDYPDAIWITGGAIGLDSWAAKFAIDHEIELWLILPFPSKVMSKKWTDEQRELLEWSIKSCSKFSVIAPTYDVSIYQRRNERMVDLSDMVAAFWDDSSGGTGNCVRYAQKVERKMVRFSDFSGKPREEGVPSPSTAVAPGAVYSPDFCRKQASKVCAEIGGSQCGGRTSEAECDCKFQRPNYREVQGDIFTSNAEVIVNSVNCVGVMGKGIALEFKKRYPEMFAEYRKVCARKDLNPGRVWVYQAKGKIIFNAAVKDDWRDSSRIAWVESCLSRLVELCRDMKIRSIALPWMGAMNGWIPVDQIKDATRRIMSAASDIDVTVYEIRQGV